MSRATLSTKGQRVLHQEIRARLGLAPGSVFEVTVEDDVIVLRRASRFPTVAVEDARGCAGYQGPARTVREMDEADALHVASSRAATSLATFDRALVTKARKIDLPILVRSP